jgi:glyoxylase-like metal-dependent hydrolase (beta-lactamase superfamily II)
MRMNTTAAVFAGLWAATAFAQQPQAVEIHVLPVQGNVYMLVGDGGNVTVQIGKEGVLLVDTGLAQGTDKLLAAVKQLSKGPIRYIINTHAHADHVGGNDKIAAAGSAIVGGNFAGQVGGASGANILAHENVLNRMSAQKPALPFAAIPTDTFFTNQHRFFSTVGCDQRGRHFHAGQLSDHRPGSWWQRSRRAGRLEPHHRSHGSRG